MRLRSWLPRFAIAGLLSVFSVSISSVSAQSDSCANLLPPRLAIGDFGRVTLGNSNNVSDTPSKAGNLVGKIPGGESFKVLDGPKCADSFNWWQVHTSDFDGWTVEATDKEYWLKPYAPKFDVTTKDNITHITYEESPD